MKCTQNAVRAWETRPKMNKDFGRKRVRKWELQSLNLIRVAKQLPGVD